MSVENLGRRRRRLRRRFNDSFVRYRIVSNRIENFDQISRGNNGMHAAVRLPFVSLSLRLVVRFDAETKHAFVTRCTRVVVGVGVFSFPARAWECVT